MSILRSDHRQEPPLFSDYLNGNSEDKTDLLPQEAPESPYTETLTPLPWNLLRLVGICWLLFTLAVVSLLVQLSKIRRRRDSTRKEKRNLATVDDLETMLASSRFEISVKTRVGDGVAVLDDSWTVGSKSTDSPKTKKRSASVRSLPGKTIIDYDEYSWTDLPKPIRKAARVLGFSQKLWSNDEQPPESNCYFHQLTPTQKQAAGVMGYTQESWDGDGKPMVETRLLNLDLSDTTKRSLGNRSSMEDVPEQRPASPKPFNIHRNNEENSVMPADGGVVKPLEVKSIDSKENSHEKHPVEQVKESIVSHEDEHERQRNWWRTFFSDKVDHNEGGEDGDRSGLSAPSDEEAGREQPRQYDGYDDTLSTMSRTARTLSSIIEAPLQEEDENNRESEWTHLSERMKTAAITLGFKEYTWNHGQLPASCRKDWFALTRDQQNSALILGYNKEKWTEEYGRQDTWADDEYSVWG